jgi:hypothetical protein
MTNDALVLMILQSRNGGPMSYDPFYNIGACRQALCTSVLAYIYSQDPFECLDCKSISLILNNALE